MNVRVRSRIFGKLSGVKMEEKTKILHIIRCRSLIRLSLGKANEVLHCMLQCRGHYTLDRFYSGCVLHKALKTGRLQIGIPLIVLK